MCGSHLLGIDDARLEDRLQSESLLFATCALRLVEREHLLRASPKLLARIVVNIFRCRGVRPRHGHNSHLSISERPSAPISSLQKPPIGHQVKAGASGHRHVTLPKEPCPSTSPCTSWSTRMPTCDRGQSSIKGQTKASRGAHVGGLGCSRPSPPSPPVAHASPPPAPSTPREKFPAAPPA